ncbi:MAG: polyhydroxyalkanoate synthesis repressor PhaR, partial [Betaproteobacteria bacterium]|nr:polyhydroxyalkanoate synthesis repressor PhaR [Betaproteobacteria bacterium]
YDTDTSSYITLAQVKQLVMDNEPFVVRDAKTGEDLTRSLLLQIILEEEAAGAPILTERVLANIIRFYGHTLQGYMGTYLEKNVQSYIDMQMQLTEQSVPSAMSNWMALQEKLQDQMKNNLQQQTDHMLRVMGLKKS